MKIGTENRKSAKNAKNAGKDRVMNIAMCQDCGRVFWACPALGLTDCPKCGSKNTHVLDFSKEAKTDEDE
jgi:predicted Zn-ribbon and HTH transcriptional regulator